MAKVLLLTLILTTLPAMANDRINPFANPGFVSLQPNASGPTVPAELTLKAVMPADEQSLANINGQLLKLGDDYFGYVLTDVTSSHVKLRKNEQDLILELRPQRKDPREKQS